MKFAKIAIAVTAIIGALVIFSAAGTMDYAEATGQSFDMTTRAITGVVLMCPAVVWLAKKGR